MNDIEFVQKFIFDELACRIHSADPDPTNAEEDSIAEARTARLAFRNLMDLLSAGPSRPVEAQPVDGLSLIAAERQRQVSVEGWSAAHDDQHDSGELIGAAIAYAVQARSLYRPITAVPPEWPWDFEWWKPSPDRIRNLVKAGALIAAEIDRLQRLNGVVPTAPPQSVEAQPPCEHCKGRGYFPNPPGVRSLIEYKYCSMCNGTGRSPAVPSPPEVPDSPQASKLWIIYFNEASMTPEIFTGGAEAISRWRECRLHWICQLFTVQAQLFAEVSPAAPDSPVMPDSSRPPWPAPWPDVLNQIHWLATRALAEPGGDTATLMAICTLLESDAPAVTDTQEGVLWPEDIAQVDTRERKWRVLWNNGDRWPTVEYVAHRLTGGLTSGVVQFSDDGGKTWVDADTPSAGEETK